MIVDVPFQGKNVDPKLVFLWKSKLPAHPTHLTGAAVFIMHSIPPFHLAFSLYM
jgi:hypothetical protein